MGKSLGNTLDPFALVDKYGCDPIRYYFLKEIELGRDGDFNETRFVNIVNADLANDLGNLLNRTLGMLHKYCQGQAPQLTGLDLEINHPLKQLGITLGDRVTSAYNSLHFDQGCTEILGLIRASNKFIDDSAPWTLYKQGKMDEVATILYSVLESVRLSAYLLSPIIPNLSNAIYQQLGFEFDFNDKNFISQSQLFTQHSSWGNLKVNQNLSKPQPIFHRLELPVETN